jgi:hypothetical protein
MDLCLVTLLAQFLREAEATLQSSSTAQLISPVRVPVLDPNLSASMPSRCSMLT